MAFLVKSNVIISDGRELVGVNTAGITTALYVGSDIQMGGASGIITATEFIGIGSQLQDIPGLSWVATDTPSVRPDGRPLQEGDIYYDSDDLRQYTRFDNAGSPIWVDSNPAANSALDYQVGSDSGQVIPGSETLVFSTDPNTVSIGVNTATDTLTFGLESDVEIATSLQVGAGVSIYGGIVTSANGTPVQYFGDGSNLTGVGLAADSDVITTGNIQAGVITATTSLEATVATGVGLTVTSDAFIGGDLEVGAGNSVTAPFFYGDGSNLTGVGLAADSDVITTGNIQAGVITATTALEATGSGIGLTVTNDAFVSGTLSVDTDIVAKRIKANGNVFEIVDEFSLPGGSRIRLEQGGGQQKVELFADNLNKVVVDAIQDNFRINVGGGSSAIFNSGGLEVGAGNSITAPFFYGDGSNLTGIGLEADSDVITTGNIQAGVITATTSLEATAATGYGLNVTSSVFVGAGLTVTGDIDANDFNATSDVTKKTNIVTIDGALGKLSELRGVTFNWIENGLPSGGIIAQDVEKVLPSLVRDGADHKTVVYNGIIGLLVEAVKELTSEVERLKESK